MPDKETFRGLSKHIKDYQRLRDEKFPASPFLSNPNGEILLIYEDKIYYAFFLKPFSIAEKSLFFFFSSLTQTHRLLITER